MKRAHTFWLLAECPYAQAKDRLPRLHFTTGQLFRFLLHWLQHQRLPPRLFWSPRLATTPTEHFGPGCHRPFRRCNLSGRRAECPGQRAPPPQPTAFGALHLDPEEHRTQIALFRYTLILPLLRGKDRLRQQIAAGHYDIPGSTRHTISAPTLARWERRYQKEGFERLKPKPRSDQG